MQINEAKLVEKTRLNENIFELKFKTKKNLNFTPGQFINIKIEDKHEFPCFRAYSISSKPNKESFELCIKVIPNGRGSNWLKNLKKNKQINFLGPTGKLKLNKEKKSHIFIATSVGIAPFKSIIENELNKKSKDKFELIMGVRYESDIFYKKNFESLANNYPNFNFRLTISRPSDNWVGLSGRVNNHIKIDPETEYYVCGSKNIVEDIIKFLLKNKIPNQQINFENF